MTQSFSAASPLGQSAVAGRRSVLVTGAAGRIGAYFAEHSHAKYTLRLMVHELDADAEALRGYGDGVVGDLGDLERMKELCRGIDTVLHLAADPDPSAVWSSLLESNIIGAYHTFVAAKAAGCRRMIYASSIHAVSGYPSDVQVKTSEPVNPGDMYGVTKCFGEALGRYMAEQEELSVIALRIGAFHATGAQPEAMPYNEFLHLVETDLYEIMIRAIEVSGVRYAVVNAISDQVGGRLDMTATRELLG